ncbi:DUF441 family protein [Brevibacterium sp. JNUCC-42]|nr:DUF441 family protein [Brevibacterium sp. JNUCC-42]
MTGLIVFILVILLSLLVKDYVLASAAGILLLIVHVGEKTWLTVIQKHAFSVGIFFLMLFLLLPFANGKASVDNIMKVFSTPTGIGAICAGFVISYIGGKGVSVLPDAPVLLIGVLVGTLIAVLFAKGLPAGLIIAAGIIALFSTK